MDGLKGEILPTVSRTLNFRLTVRDNKNGGGGVATGGNGCSSTAPFTVNVDGAAGPFIENVPNGGEIWTGGSAQNVTWNVANTNNGTVNCQFVTIYMSIDGGNTYPTLIASHVANNGSYSSTVPNIATNNKVRYLIKCEDNLFFDVSNANFMITNDPSLPMYSIVENINTKAIQVQVVPNPAKETITFKWSGIENQSLNFEITNLLGSTVKSGVINTNGAINQNKVSVEELPAGIYLVRFDNPTFHLVTRFIKQ
jgi:hypothetical protein